NRPVSEAYEQEFKQRVMARMEERLDQFPLMFILLGFCRWHATMFSHIGVATVRVVQHDVHVRDQVDSLSTHGESRCKVTNGMPVLYGLFFVAPTVAFSFKVVRRACDGCGQWVKNDLVWKVIG
ncbi:hypothetical protein Tco_1088687, partial [Tanacetum coccineum]